MLLAEFLCFGTVVVVILHCVFVAAEVPWFGLRLSCFGHVRAKTNTELPCGLELCPVFVWDLSPVVCLLHRAVKGCFAAGMQWLSPWDVLAWLVC